MQCLILAGGLGTRMQAQDSHVPKAMLPVAGRPFVHWQLSWLAGQGADGAVLSIGHLGGQIRDFVRDGAAWHLPVTYVEEGDDLRGTGGAVRLAVDEGALSDSFFVLYGDSYLQVALRDVQTAFEAAGLPALMTVYENDGKWDASNVICEGNVVVHYEKGCSDPPQAMRFIDYGLSVMRAELVRELIPPREHHDLAEFFTTLSTQGRLGAFIATQRFYEIGSPEGLAELDRLLAPGGTGSP
jgi:NDP-sugar pyrophosphorylase family protein